MAIFDFQRPVRNEVTHIENKPKPRWDGTGLLYPLSFGQEQIWIREKEMRHSQPEQNDWFTIDFPLRFEMHTLRKGLKYFFDQHEMWRYRVDPQSDDGRACLVNPADFCAHVDVVDLSHMELTDGLQESLKIGHAKKESANLLTSDLIQFIVFNLDGDYKRLYVFVHLITLSETSHTIVGEIIAAYKAIRSQEDPKLRGLTVHDWDYSIWLRGCFQIQDVDEVPKIIKYWEGIAEGFDAVALPSDKADMKQDTGPDKIVTKNYPFSRTLYKILKPFWEKENVDPFVFLIAMWKVILFRYSMQKNQSHTIWTDSNTFPSRKYRPVFQLVGQNSNLTITKVSFGKIKFITMLRKVDKALREALAHSDFPFQKMVDFCSYGYGLKESKRGVLSSAIQLLTIPGTTRDPPPKGDFREPITMKNGFDLVLTIIKRDAEFQLAVSYNSKYFGEERIDALIRHWKVMLENAAEKPETKLECIEMMSQQEQEYMLKRFSSGNNRRE